ncbi:esterase [Mycobacterium numidiamassiliense]|uniref:esterase n=1 Tax=Mycobacterium numidiamassiliense TaxID=1841861 RepID=UPI001FEA11F1|nr:esterase [Mycobacterium numidiamassiliense]
MNGSAQMAGIVATLAAAAAIAWPAAASADAQMCPRVDGNQMCHFEASGPFSNIDMVFPANYPDEQAITGYLSKVADDYGNARGPLSTLTSPTELDVTSDRYSSGPPQSGTQSVVAKIYQNLGGAHPSTWYKSFNYNLATHTPITFDALFRPGTQPLQAILPIVQKTLTDRYGSAVSIPTDAGLNPANYQSFAITNDAIVFFFDQNGLQPALEATQVSVPRSAIASVISPGI